VVETEKIHVINQIGLFTVLMEKNSHKNYFA